MVFKIWNILPFLGSRAIQLIGARIRKRIAHDTALLQRNDPGIMGTPFQQHLFDFTPLLEQELVLHPAGVIRASNSFGKTLGSTLDPGQEVRSRLSGNIDACSKPVHR
jgi:hypothetical protein